MGDSRALPPIPLHGPARRPPLAPRRDPAEGLYRRYLRAALFCTLTLGTSFGAFNLLSIHLSLGEIPPAHQWLHGTFQIAGFIQLFIFGVALQMVPRFVGVPLAHPAVAKAPLALVLVAIVLRSIAAFHVPGALAALVASAVLDLAGTLAFAAAIFGTFRSAQAKRDAFQPSIGSGIAGWIASALVLCAGAARALAERDAASATSWNEAFYLCALFGGALPFVQGVLRRAGPVLLPLAAQPSPVPSAVLGVAGTALCVLGAAPLGFGEPWLDAGLLCVSASVALTARLRVAEGGPGDETARIVRVALGFALVFAALASLYAILDLFTGAAPRLLFDAARHAYGLGFLTVLIFGMAGRIVPAFAGHDLRLPRLRFWGAMLTAGGAGLRMVQALAALTGWEWPLFVSGPSGIVAATGVALASVSVLATLRPSRRPLPPA